MAATATPLIFKSQKVIFRTQIRHRTAKDTFRRRRLTHLRLLPLPYNLHSHSFPILHRNILPNPFIYSLHRSYPHPMSSSAPNSSPTKTVRVVIKGRVQGVFYRNWTVENAMELGLRGWVRNRRDGYVEALFSGTPEKVQEMEQRCRRGPPAAMVTGFEVFPCNDDPGTGFERRPTV